MLIAIKRGTTAQWAARATPLQLAEPGLDITLGVLKFGDGVTLWAALPVYPAGAAVTFPAPVALGGFFAGVTAGAPAPTVQQGAGNRAYLAGQLSLAAATYANGTQLFVVNAGYLPAPGPVQFLVRTVGSNTQFQLNIDTLGHATNVGQIIVGATDTINLDGFSYVHA